MISRSARRYVFSVTAIAVAGLSAGMLAPSNVAYAQDADASAQYADLLEQISNLRSNITLDEFYVAQQEETITTLQSDIEEVADADADAELRPIVEEMVAELEKVMVSDLPFQVETRFELLDNLREDLRGENAISVSEAFRRAMELYQSEVELGLQVTAYNGLNPVNPGVRYQACVEDVNSAKCDLSEELFRALDGGALIEDLEEQIYDGSYVNFGRLALMYLDRDSAEGYRYNQEAGEWQSIPNSEILSLRQNVRIANGDSAPNPMIVPIRVQTDAEDAS